MKSPIIREISYFPKANKDPNVFFHAISPVSGPFALMTITKTGLKKSIIDATWAVRYFLNEVMIHDYSVQKQGQNNKVLIKTHFIKKEQLLDSSASLYRPITKKGDPRIWFKGLQKYASENDLLLIFSVDKELFVANLSNDNLWETFLNHGYLYNLMCNSKKDQIKIKDELLILMKKIHEKGWIEAIGTGDMAVGDTLEHELGIKRNNSRFPDYKGIEIKASRTSINGRNKSKTRITLFAKVPDSGMTYNQILHLYGKMQTPRNSNVARLQLYETFKVSKVNAYDLFLRINNNKERLEIINSLDHDIDSLKNTYVSSWKFQNLANSLKEKHKETFFVKAESKIENGKEYFLYNKILHTQNPNASLFFVLLDKDIITLDLLAHEENGKYRDHGSLFKIHPDSIPLLFGEPEIFNLY